MLESRRRLPGFAALAFLAALPAGAQLPAIPDGYADVATLMSAAAASDRKSAARRIIKGRDLTLLPGLVDALFFARREVRPEVYAVLEQLSGQKLEQGYYAWVEYVGAHAELAPKAGYRAFKAQLFGRIDPDFARFLAPDRAMAIRAEEIVWGGVRRDGIPALEEPATVPANEATFMRAEEPVYGVVLGGEARAYPVRILSWHEMTNDTVGGEPITLSFCTLCGTAIVYSGKKPGGGRREFGTSGLLYRSNKLMYDRETFTLWNNLTGEPAVGPLVGSGARLEVIPMTRTSWMDWQRHHPATRVLSLDQEAGRRAGYRYEPGAADRARAGVAFPVWQKSDRLPRSTEVLALTVGDAARAYPLASLFTRRVVNDRVGGKALVILADPTSGAVRAFERAGQTFRAGANASEVLDQEGTLWRLDEASLTSEATPAETLPRYPAHLAFWFGWYGFYPHTEVWEGSESPPP